MGFYVKKDHPLPSLARLNTTNKTKTFFHHPFDVDNISMAPVDNISMAPTGI